MSDLKANLAKLETAVPALPEKVAAVAKSADALEQTANGMLQQFATKQQEAADLAEQVKQALTDLQGEGTDAEGLVRNKMDDVEHAAEAALGAIRSARDELMAAVEGAGEAYEGLRGNLAAAEGRVRAAHQEADQALNTLESGAEAAGTQLGTGNEAMTGAIAATGQQYENGATKVGEGGTALRQKMGEMLETAHNRIDASNTALTEASSAVDSGMGEAISDLGARKDTLYQELTARVESELRQRLDTALQGVVDALGLLSQTVTVTRDGIQAEREGVAGEFDELKKRHPPLNAGVESVKQAAVQVEVAY